MAVITNAGGPAILAVDKLENEGLELAALKESTKNKLRSFVHPEGSVENPVDLLPGATAETYKKVNQVVVEDDNVDAVISIFVEPVMVRPFEVVESINDIDSIKPILQVCMPLPEFWNIYKKASKKHLPIFRAPEDPTEVIANMLFHFRMNQKMSESRRDYQSILMRRNKGKYKFNPGFLSPREIILVAKDYNIPLVINKLINADEINTIAGESYPLVIKGINSNVIHKTEMKGVKLNITNREALLAGAEEIKSNFTKYGFEVQEFLIQPFINIKHEVLIGGFRDPSFGPIVMFGSGGKYVEVLGDTAVKSAYMASSDLDDIIDSTMIGKIISGVRGEEPCDLSKIKEIISAAAVMLIENESIIEFDLNPLIIAQDNSVHAVDIRIKVN